LAQASIRLKADDQRSVGDLDKFFQPK